jgi:hypothetical protein
MDNVQKQIIVPLSLLSPCVSKGTIWAGLTFRSAQISDKCRLYNDPCRYAGQPSNCEAYCATDFHSVVAEVFFSQILCFWTLTISRFYLKYYLRR